MPLSNPEVWTQDGSLLDVLIMKSEFQRCLSEGRPRDEATCIKER